MIPEDQFDDVLADQLAELDIAGDAHAFAQRNPAWHPEDAALRALAARQTTRFVVERSLVDNRPWWYLDLLGDVQVTTMIIGADPDRGAMFDPTIGEELARRNTRVRTMTVSGAGHSVHRDAADTIVGVLLADDARS
jgi:pimeloyl-ACP methyl ester carboxylesterase